MTKKCCEYVLNPVSKITHVTHVTHSIFKRKKCFNVDLLTVLTVHTRFFQKINVLLLGNNHVLLTVLIMFSLYNTNLKNRSTI